MAVVVWRGLSGPPPSPRISRHARSAAGHLTACPLHQRDAATSPPVAMRPSRRARSAVRDRHEAAAVMGAFLVDGRGGYDDPGKATAKRDGVVQIEPCAFRRVLRQRPWGFTAVLGLAGRDDRTDSRSTLRAFQVSSVEALPKQPSVVSRPANRTVERLLLRRSSSRHERAVLHAVNSLPCPESSAVFADTMFTSIFSHNSV